MKSILLSLLFASTLSLATLQAQPMASDNKMARPLGQVLDRVEQQFGVRFKYNVDTTGKGFVAGEPNKYWTVQVRLEGDKSGNFDPNSTVGTNSYAPTRSTKHDDITRDDNILDYAFIIPRGVQVLGGYKGERIARGF